MKLKVMSFNLRLDVANDGINQFFNRTDRVLDVITKENPDLIGFQEVTDKMKEWLRDNLKEYTVVGCGREKNYLGESMLIAYKSKDMELIELKNKWYSEIPNIPGSKYGGDQSFCPRMFTSIRVKHKEIEEPFWFVNTHFDHVGKEARMKEAIQLVKELKTYTEKFILTGDFNATPDSPEITYMNENIKGIGGIDLTAKLGPTFHDFGRLEKPIKIDYIFSNFEMEESYLVKDIPIEGKYYSDHNAIISLFLI